MSMSRTNGMSEIIMPGHIHHVFDILTFASSLLPQNVDVCQLITIIENSRKSSHSPSSYLTLHFYLRVAILHENFAFEIHRKPTVMVGIETFSWLEVLYG